MLEKLLKNNPFILNIYIFFGSLFFRFVGLFVSTKKIVLFSSYSGDSFNDSPLFIYKEFKERFPDFECIWAFKDPKKYPDLDKKNKVKIDSFRYFIIALKAKVWVTNVNIERGLHFKKRETIYLNTWHGTGIKKAGNAVKNRKDYDFSYVDILTSDGPLFDRILIEDFNANKKSIIHCGRPREDGLFIPGFYNSQIIKRKYNIPANKKIILYVPTFRDANSALFETVIDFSKMEKELSKEYVVVFKSHHYVKKVLNATTKNNFVIFVDDCEDLCELFYVADIMVTDFSSCLFDYSYLNRPIYIFAPDFDSFESKRGFKINLKSEYPVGVFSETSSLIEAIKQNTYKKQSDCVKEFFGRYLINDRDKYCATNVCVSHLENLLK